MLIYGSPLLSSFLWITLVLSTDFDTCLVLLVCSSVYNIWAVTAFGWLSFVLPSSTRKIMNKQIFTVYLLDIQASLNLVPNLVALSLNMHYMLNIWSKYMQYRHDKHLKHSSVVSNIFFTYAPIFVYFLFSFSSWKSFSLLIIFKNFTYL